MNKIDHNKEFNRIISSLSSDAAGSAPTLSRPKLLLHACCAPCASICMDRVRDPFDTTAFFFNPNITISEEHDHRSSELERLIDIYNDKPNRHKIAFLEGEYNPQAFFDMAKGYEDCPERGARCHLCYELRLRTTAEAAIAGDFDYFATTLTLSPLKDANVLNEIGYRLQEEYSNRVLWLPSDFKKEEGYKKSIELSKQYGLYRQNYCGCVYSKPDTEA